MAATPKEPPENQGPPEQKKSNTPGAKNQSSPHKPSKSSQKVNPFIALLEPFKQKAMAAHPELWGEGAAAEPEATPIKKASGSRKRKKRSEHEEFLLHSHKGFPDLYRESFRGNVRWEVFDFIWKHAKQQPDKPLRWEGYQKDVALKIKRSEIQVKRAFKSLREKNFIHRWHQGDVFGGKSVYTIAKNPADFIRMSMIRRRKDRKEAKR